MILNTRPVERACAAVVLVQLATTAVGQNNTAPYQRPYGHAAAWNIPVTLIRDCMGDAAIDPASAALSASAWHDAPAHHAGNWNIAINEYTLPVYEADEATIMAPVDVAFFGNLDGEFIPWNPAWQAANGTDAQVVVIDNSTGREWNLFQVTFDGTTVHCTNGSLVMETIPTGQTDPNGNPTYEITDTVADIRSYEGPFLTSRGCGIQYLAMLVRPEEIMQGEIRHALCGPIRNTDGERFVAPAIKLEHDSNPPGIPEGTRFAIDVTDAEIEAWIASLPPELVQQRPQLVQTARVLGTALRDYGWIITDTGGGASFQCEWRDSAASEWSALGMDDITINGFMEYPRDLFDGLITENNIYTVVPSDQYPTWDVDADGRVDIEDLYAQHQTPIDVNRDGVIDSSDRRCIEMFLRRDELFDMSAGRR